MLELFFKYPAVLQRMRQGPLKKSIADLAENFARSGYARDTSIIYLRLVAGFSRYAAAAGCITTRDIDQSHVRRFIRNACRSPCVRSQARAALGHVLPRLLKRRSLGNEQRASRPDERILVAFDDHLREVRGLRDRSRDEPLRIARRMLQWYRARAGGRALSKLRGEDVLAFIANLTAQYAAHRSRSAAVSRVRVFVRYLRWEGILREDLALVIPRMPCWPTAQIPSHLSWLEIRRAIDAVDISTPIGKRDRALMLLLATTGLRSREVLRLELGDIRWRTSEIHVRKTKGRRDRAVPLLEETGKALSDYLLDGRPRIADARVFLCHRPPIRPIAISGTLSAIIRHRLAACGVRLPRMGAGLLRHSLATRMVQEDRPVKEVADLLGHRSIDTTAIYVKVALPQLVSIALPFPEVAP